MGGRREDLIKRNGIDVMRNGRMDVRQGANSAVCGRTATSADRRGTFRAPSPAAFQLVQSGVEFTPLTTGEEPPFQSVLEPLIVFAFAAAGDLSAGAANIKPVQQRVMPRAVVGAFANQRIQFAPRVGGDRFLPVVEVAQND